MQIASLRSHAARGLLLLLLAFAFSQLLHADQLPTTTTLTISPGAPTTGDTITLTATITPAAAGVPYSHGVGFIYYNGQGPAVQIIVAPSNGIASTTIGPLAAGTYTVQCGYLGLTDPNPGSNGYSPSNAPTATLTVTQPGGAAGPALQGQYAFLYQGFVSGKSGTASAGAGSFTADGQGNITGGVLDLVTSFGVNLRDSVSGSYTLDTNGRGTLTLTGTHSGTQTLSFTTPSSQAASTVQTATATAYGGSLLGTVQIAKQTPSAFSLPLLAGQYALHLEGGIGSGPASIVLGTGSLTLNANGTAASVVDQTANNLVTQGIPYATASTPASTPDPATGIFSILLSPSGTMGTGFPILSYDVLPIDAQHLFLLDTNPEAEINGSSAFGVLSGVAAQ